MRVFYTINKATAKKTNTAPLNQFRLRFAFGDVKRNFFTVPAKSAMLPKTIIVAKINSPPKIAICKLGWIGRSKRTAGGISESTKRITFGFVRFMIMPRM